MSADEFAVIRELFAPLATHAGARGLVDDAAVLEAQGALVVTTDAIVEGVHFLIDDPIDTVAKKALRVNVSDIVAKGAKPVAALLTLVWPNARPSDEIATFARGLGEDLQHYGVALIGGDTTSTPGPLTVSITLFGQPLGSRTPARTDAKPGEQLWVTGRIGDGWLGLMLLQEAPAVLGAAAADRVGAHIDALRAAYRTPPSPLAFAPIVARYASASMDVSDGLIADAAKLASASGVALRIDAEAVPLSDAGHAHVSAHGPNGLLELLSGGDDYQVLFTAPAEARGRIMDESRAANIDVALIGDVLDGAGLWLVGAGGAELALPGGGHVHKLGS